VAAQAGALSYLFAGEPDEHPSGMELRTGNSNQRHEEIVCAAAIAHNVNQAASRGSSNTASVLHRAAPPLASALVRSKSGAISSETGSRSLTQSC
jgi:hypothetical protein